MNHSCTGKHSYAALAGTVRDRDMDTGKAVVGMDLAVNPQTRPENDPESGRGDGHRSPQDDSEIQAGLTLLTFQGYLRPAAVSSVGVVSITGALAFLYHDRWLWTAAGLMLMLGIARPVVIAAFPAHRAQQMGAAEALRWERGFGLLTLLFCSSVAAATVHNYACHDMGAQAMSAMGIFALCAGLSSRVGMRPWISLASGYVMLGPLALASLRLSSPIGFCGFLLVCFFGYAYLEAVRNKFMVVVEQLHTRRLLRELSERDPLTGLANRRFFEQRLKAACLGLDPFTVLYIDLDRFKQVNDTHGHAIGDLLLKQASERILRSVRASDLVARLGGDEFAVLQVPAESEDMAADLADCINQAMAVPFLLQGTPIEISASIGICPSIGGAQTPVEMLDRADAELYRVKKSGGNSFARGGGDRRESNATTPVPDARVAVHDRRLTPAAPSASR